MYATAPQFKRTSLIITYIDIYVLGFLLFLLPSCQIDVYMKVSMSWPDMAFCFMPGASHHHKDDVGYTGTQF
jgi:TRAP-type mannitol/chloroaromatic compound transport system permease small subunit